MKLLNIIASTNPEHGGVIEWVRLFSIHATQLGHTIEIASMDNPDDPWVTDSPLKVHAFGQHFHNFYARGLKQWIKEHRSNYDAIIAHGLWRYPSFATWLALKYTDTPYFVYTHGMLDPWFKKNAPLKHAAKWLYWPWTDYRALRDAKGVIFTCEQERIKARESFWLYRSRELVATIGIEAAAADEAHQLETFYHQFPETRNQRLLLFLGRIHPKKGCDLLINSFARVASQDKQLRLVIAGPDNTSWVPALKKLAKENHVAERITWTGMIKGDTKAGAFRAAEVFVLPSHQENFGIAVVEAMAHGTPVIISDKVDIYKEIQRDSAGLVHRDNLTGTERALLEWLQLSAQERNFMAERALNCFKQRFEVVHATQALLDLIQRKTNEPS